MTRLKIIILLTVCGIVTAGEVKNNEFEIAYISAAHVYLKGGDRDGLGVGDELIIFRGDEKIGRIRVEFVSHNSASARVLEKKKGFEVGDIARLVKKEKLHKTIILTNKSDSVISQKERSPEKKTKSIIKGSATKIDGYVSSQYYYFNDLSAQNYNFSKPTLRLRLRIKNLWNRYLNFELKFRSRYNMRQRSFSGKVPKSEWQNRLYQCSIDYNAPDARFSYKLGRIISNAFSGVGYIDGILAALKLTDTFYSGVFAGTQPDWRTSNFQTEIQKYGGYLKFERGEFGSKKINTTLAAVGEYHGRTVSREFLYFQTSYYHGRRWNISQNLELDINRDWRKNLTGQTLSLSGLYLNASYQIISGIRTSLSYDNRKNYYTYELKSIADSLFDNSFRHGLRVNFYINVLKNYQFSLNFGIREQSTDANFSYNYGLNISRRNFFSKYNRMDFRFSGFDNVFATGFNPTITFSRYFFGKHYLSFSYWNYYYKLKNINDNKLNQWLRISGRIELTEKFYLNPSCEYDWGDDVQGYRMLFELGYRL